MSIRAHADAKLTQAQLEELASNLADKRYELAAKLEILNRQITMKEDCSLADAAEAASLREEIARASGIADQHNRIIAEIDRALRRLETGRYGNNPTTPTTPPGLSRGMHARWNNPTWVEPWDARAVAPRGARMVWLAL